MKDTDQTPVCTKAQKSFAGQRGTRCYLRKIVFPAGQWTGRLFSHNSAASQPNTMHDRPSESEETVVTERWGKEAMH